jgi:hypothetical protein
MTEPKMHGGKRPGAGRKPNANKSRMVYFRASQPTYYKLQAEAASENKSIYKLLGEIVEQRYAEEKGEQS